MSESKQCTRCGEIKPLDQYRFKGKGKRRAYCHKCENRKNTERIKRKKVYTELYLKQLESKKTGVRTCNICGKTKENNRFTGFICKTCEGKKRRDHNILRAKLFLNQLKLQSGCILCGFNQYAAALDFHHINDSNKENNVSSRNLLRMSIAKIMDEVSKCVVLCANCHRGVHSQDIPLSRIGEAIEKNNVALPPTRRGPHGGMGVHGASTITHDF